MIKWIKKKMFKHMDNLVVVEGLDPYERVVYGLSYDKGVRVVSPVWWKERKHIKRPTRDIAEKLLEARRKGVLSMDIPSSKFKSTVDGSVLAGKKDSGNVLKIGITSMEGNIKIRNLFMVYNGKSSFYCVDDLFNGVEEVFLIGLLQELRGERRVKEEWETRDKITNNLSHMLL